MCPVVDLYTVVPMGPSGFSRVGIIRWQFRRSDNRFRTSGTSLFGIQVGRRIQPGTRRTRIRRIRVFHLGTAF